MTGTACLINDCAGNSISNTTRRSRNLDLLSAWLFGKVNTACLLVDISSDGGAVLVPVKQSVPAEAFDLVIMSPENKDEALIILRAEKHWINESYSRSHKKVGMRFQYAGQEKTQEINTLSSMLAEQKQNNLKCYLLNH